MDGGSILIGGVDIRELSLEEYNRRVAYVSQDNYLFDDTIRENIRMGRMDATDAEVEEVAKRADAMSLSWDSKRDMTRWQAAREASFRRGKTARIAIARAMLKDAPIVILDEATAYTDPENEAVIQAGVARLVQGKTLIVIAHRLSTIADADKIFVVNGGRIVEEGTHGELLAKGNCMRKCGNRTSAREVFLMTFRRWTERQEVLYVSRGRMPKYGILRIIERKVLSMIKIYRKFFSFCGENSRKFYISLVYGVILAFMEAMKIPAVMLMLQEPSAGISRGD